VCFSWVVPASLTRIVSGLHEESEIPVDDDAGFSTRLFSISWGADGWLLETRADSSTTPSFFDETANGVSLNSKDAFGIQPLVDDDLIEAGTSLWVFHCGAVARQNAIEEAALTPTATEASWQVLADWLLEKGDPLGERIARNRGTQNLQQVLLETADVDSSGLVVFVDSPGRGITAGLGEGGLTPGDAMFRLEVDEQHGVVRRLTARSLSLSNVDEVAAALHLRRLRFLEHLVLDFSAAAPGRGARKELFAYVEKWALPRWLRTISFGALYGAAPTEWRSPLVPKQLKERCPRLEVLPLVRWSSQASLELESDAGHFKLSGLERGHRIPICPGIVLEGENSEVRLCREVKVRGSFARHYRFEVEDSRWILRASDLNGSDASADWTRAPKQLAASVAARRVRPRSCQSMLE